MQIPPTKCVCVWVCVCVCVGVCDVTKHNNCKHSQSKYPVINTAMSLTLCYTIPEHTHHTLLIGIDLEAVGSSLYVTVYLVDVLIKNDHLDAQVNAKVDTVTLDARNKVFDEFVEVLDNGCLFARNQSISYIRESFCKLVKTCMETEAQI